MIDNCSVQVVQAVVHLVPNIVICHICQDTLHTYITFVRVQRICEFLCVTVIIIIVSYVIE